MSRRIKRKTKQMKKTLTVVTAVVLAGLVAGCATEGPAPRTHAKSIHLGVDTNGVPTVDIIDYNNPKDLVIAYDPATKTFSLKSSNNPNVIDSSSAANAAYLTALASLLQTAFQAGANAAATSGIK